MRAFKPVLISMISASITLIASNVQAQSLYTHNITNADATCIINDGFCSTDILHEKGITHPGAVNETSRESLLRACIGNKTDCKADIYMTNNCDKTGASKIATVKFDVLNEGFKSVEMFDNNYKIEGQGFDLFISGGSAKIKNLG